MLGFDMLPEQIVLDELELTHKTGSNITNANTFVSKLKATFSMPALATVAV